LTDHPQQEAVDRLVGLFNRRNDDGGYRYSIDELRAFMPLLILAAGDAISELGPELEKLFHQFTQRLVLPDDPTPEDIQASVEKYYEDNPLNEELLEAVRRFIETESTAGMELGKRAAKLVGQEMSKIPLGDRDKPEGATSASPLARFTMKVPDED
jgi:hypothetical protein